MSNIVNFHIGGFIPGAVQQNRSELYDESASTYTAWDVAGNVTSTRPLTTAEVTQLAAQDAAAALFTNQSALQSKAQAALTANQNDVTQDQAIITQAATITAASITNLATAATAIGKLAQAVSILASNDINTKKELQAIIYLVLAEFAATTGT